MNIYYVPIIGFAWAVIKYMRDYRALEACRPGPCWSQYDATWPALDNVTVAMISTMAFLFILMALFRYMAFRKPLQRHRLRRAGTP
jgi:hypothetical protein